MDRRGLSGEKGNIGCDMNNEVLIRLDLERQEDSVLVSSPEFPLLHLAIDAFSETEIEKHVLVQKKVSVFTADIDALHHMKDMFEPSFWFSFARKHIQQFGTLAVIQPC